MDCSLIYNGVNIPIKSNSKEYIENLGLKENQYMIAVGRFVEEKGFHDLIEAYKNIETSVKLVIVGDADHENDYSLKLKKQARENGVILTGFIRGEKLNQIFSYAKLFVMPSYHEGLPIALLEAMSYNLDILVSDIPANLKVNLDNNDYFPLGDIDKLKEKLKEKILSKNKKDFIKIIKTQYNWDTISKEIYNLYLKA